VRAPFSGVRVVRVAALFHVSGLSALPSDDPFRALILNCLRRLSRRPIAAEPAVDPKVTPKKITPVTLPPGRSRLAKRPIATGSLPLAKTIHLRLSFFGQCQQLVGDFETKRLRGPEIGHQLKFRGLLDRQVGRLLAFEYPPGVDTGLAIGIGVGWTRSSSSRRPVAHQAAGHDGLAPGIDCRQRMAGRQRDNPFSMGVHERASADEQRTSPTLYERACGLALRHFRANAAPRCGARSKRTGKPCRAASSKMLSGLTRTFPREASPGAPPMTLRNRPAKPAMARNDQPRLVGINRWLRTGRMISPRLVYGWPLRQRGRRSRSA
jgi:hypothetical protein